MQEGSVKITASISAHITHWQSPCQSVKGPEFDHHHTNTEKVALGRHCLDDPWHRAWRNQKTEDNRGRQWQPHKIPGASLRSSDVHTEYHSRIQSVVYSCCPEYSASLCHIIGTPITHSINITNACTQRCIPIFYPWGSLPHLLLCPSSNCSPPMWHRYPLCLIMVSHAHLLETDLPQAGIETVCVMVWVNMVSHRNR